MQGQAERALRRLTELSSATPAQNCAAVHDKCVGMDQLASLHVIIGEHLGLISNPTTWKWHAMLCASIILAPHAHGAAVRRCRASSGAQ